MNANVSAEQQRRAQPLRGIQKVAALLLAMGKPNASRLLRHFDQEEIRLITLNAAQLGAVSSSELDSLADEFLNQFAHGASLFGTAGEVEKMLDGVLPEDAVSEIMSDVLGNSNRSIWDRITTVSETVLANYLAKEHPQTAALILSKIRPTSAAKVLSQLPTPLRNQLMRRMLSIKPIVQEIMRDVEKTLHEDFMLNLSGSMEADSFARMADILNKMDREHMEEALTSLNDERPKSAEMLKGLLFTFDDIVNLNARTKMAVFDQISTDNVVMALKGTSPQFRESILSSLTSRMRRIVEFELNSGQPSTQREVLEARRTITDLALEMAGRGEIDLNPKQEERTYFS
ncbi:flagellar motor switch protein FliG [Breoghania sp.]|uniref:flagellar motor switch protein FliG n=1 Tax=Breoghania sp. TaxID=2065378 RepID=UPI0029CA0C19|nr:flagellar motor switch protein FliG [Breoghania sp.]